MDIPEIEISSQFIDLILVFLFSFLIGLEQGKIHRGENRDPDKAHFGTARTFLFTGVFGFILYTISPSLWPFLTGEIIFAGFLALFYLRKAVSKDRFGLTGVMLGMITYNLPALIITQPLWLSLIVFVVILIFAQLKEEIHGFYEKLESDEFLTLAKFIVISGIILPILPKEPILPALTISPFKIWLAIVVISGISYLSYLMQRYALPESGIVLSAFFGGMYSSTATTVVLSKKFVKDDQDKALIASSIFFATAIMYIRVQILALIFNAKLALALLPYFLILFAATSALAYLFYRKRNKQNKGKNGSLSNKNPLELRTALIFALLYILFSFLTEYAIDNFGETGIKTLSWLIGITYVDPFLLNIFQGKFTLSQHILVSATLQALIGNNLLKLVLAHSITGSPLVKYLYTGFGVIIALGLAQVVVLSCQ